MTIKKATMNELDSLSELFNLYRVYYEQETDLEGAKGFLKERFLNKESVVFIAFDEEKAVGFTQLYPTFSSVSMKRTWVLNDLFVKETARGKGYGEKLVNEAISYSKETGTKGLLLETTEDNLRARALYEKIGFQKESNYFYFYSNEPGGKYSY